MFSLFLIIQQKEKASRLIDSKGDKNVAICMVFKNEASMIEEYVAFHHLVGVGKFILYDDHSTDNVSALPQAYL